MVDEKYDKWLRAISKDHNAILEIPREKWTNELCLATVKRDYAAIHYMLEEHLTKEICLLSDRQSSSVIRYVPKNLRELYTMHIGEEDTKEKKMNEKLAGLYKNVNVLGLLNDYIGKNDTDDWTYPLLLRSYPEYESAEIKVMVFGKDTYGWIPEQEDIGNNGIDVDCLMTLYGNFFNKGNCAYSSQFFPIINELIEMLREKQKRKSVRYLWNDIVKIGRGGSGFPEKMYNDFIKDNVNPIISMEIEILRPNLIIFFSGPNTDQSGPYDDVLNDVFNNPERKSVEGFDERRLCEIIIPNIEKSFRLYHPRYLSTIDYKRDFQKIISEI